MKRCLPLLLISAAISFLNLPAQAASIQKIAFGSCAKEHKKQPIWQAINKEQAELFIFLGDNIYADTKNPKTIEKKYQKLGAQPGFQKLRKQSTVIATWDDHDYGQNDAGLENPIKNESRKIMLDFWQEAEDSARRTQPGGIYASYYFGEAPQRVQIILLDLRWNRTALDSVNQEEYSRRKSYKQGPYKVIADKNAVLLGETQWQWLEKELQQPAELRIIGSSLQVLADFTGWEAWANFPAELKRLYSLIQAHKVEGLFFISGDTHWAELSEKRDGLPYPLYDLTSSGLTEEWHAVSPNKYRTSKPYSSANYGLIEINWQQDPEISLSIKDNKGEQVIQKKIKLSSLRFQ